MDRWRIWKHGVKILHEILQTQDNMSIQSQGEEAFLVAKQVAQCVHLFKGLPSFPLELASCTAFCTINVAHCDSFFRSYIIAGAGQEFTASSWGLVFLLPVQLPEGSLIVMLTLQSFPCSKQQYFWFLALHF